MQCRILAGGGDTVPTRTVVVYCFSGALGVGRDRLHPFMDGDFVWTEPSAHDRRSDDCGPRASRTRRCVRPSVVGRAPVGASFCSIPLTASYSYGSGWVTSSGLCSFQCFHCAPTSACFDINARPDRSTGYIRLAHRSGGCAAVAFIHHPASRAANHRVVSAAQVHLQIHIKQRH